MGLAVTGYACKRAGSFGLGLDTSELMKLSEKSQNNPVKLCGSHLNVVRQRFKSLEKTGHLSSNYLTRIISAIGVEPSTCHSPIQEGGGGKNWLNIADESEKL